MEERQNKIEEEKEVDFLTLANKMWASKNLIIRSLSIGLIVGLVVAFSIPKEYTATVILTPESQSTTSGNMGSLAALAGINVSNTNGIDALASPDLYPNVINSTPFLKGLLNIRIVDLQTNIDTTMYSYMSDYQSVAWWNYILKVPGFVKRLLFTPEKTVVSNDKSNDRFISEEEQMVLRAMADRLIISSDKKTGVTTIDVIMQNPNIAAFVADTVTSYLQSYIIKYRTQKARTDQIFAEELYDEAQTNYHESQQKLATFIDGNMHVVSARYAANQKKLEDEMALAFSIYTQTAQQLQLAKVKVQDTTPVFTVIQPAVEPLYPTKPLKKLILVGFVFFAFVSVTVWILRKDIYIIVFSS